jgi:hypothetical protein
MIVIDLLSIKIITPRTPYPSRRRIRRSKPSAHPFDLFYLLVWKLVGAIVCKPRKPRRDPALPSPSPRVLSNSPWPVRPERRFYAKS